MSEYECIGVCAPDGFGYCEGCGRPWPVEEETAGTVTSGSGEAVSPLPQTPPSPTRLPDAGQQEPDAPGQAGVWSWPRS